MQTIYWNPGFEARFRTAWAQRRVILFSAPCGSGKTCVATELLKHTDALWYSGQDPALSDPEGGFFPGDRAAVVVDDLQALSQPEAQKALCTAIQEGSAKKFLLLSRGPIPGYLMPFRFSGLMAVFDVQDLLLDRAESQKMLTDRGAVLTAEDMTELYAAARGYGLLLSILADRLRGGTRYDRQVLAAAKLDLFRYLDNSVFIRMERTLRNLLLSVAPFEVFDEEMARLISGDDRSGELLSALRRDTTMLLPERVEAFRIYPLFREFLLWRMEQTFSAEQRSSLLRRAGLYYELKNELDHALDCYSKCGDSHKISEILEKYAQLHPGLGHYYEMEPYYRALPRQEVLRSPSMMCCMSMLCALTMDYEGSDQWYDELSRYAARLKRGDSEYKDVRGKLAFLDISLSQRGSKGLVELFTAVHTMVSNRDIHLQALSVTSTLPSLMNGSKDFCAWSKRDEFLYATLGKPMESILGRDGVCFADACLCESRFEKGEDVLNQLLTLMGRLGEVQNKGSPDIEFAIVGLFARRQIQEGKADAAWDIVSTLREKFQQTGQTRFLPNIDALLCRIALRTGDKDYVNQWLKYQAPKDTLRLHVLWRYQYLTRAMAELQNGDYSSALLILAQMETYCTRCGRTMDGITTNLLTALCRHRMGDERWRPALMSAVDAAYEYGFFPVISSFGAAVLPLLPEWKKDKRYAARLLAETRRQAVCYPDFLAEKRALLEPLTDAETAVLRLLCHDRSNQEIGDILGIKLATVKTHVSRILQKLGVSRRSEAKSAAESLHLLEP